MTSEKEIVVNQVAPNEESTDVHTTDHAMPRENVKTDLNIFKENNQT